MVYRNIPYDARPLFFPKKTIPGYERAGYERALEFVEERGLKLASHKVLEEHIQRSPEYGPVWAREIIAYPECGYYFRRRDHTDVSGWVLPAGEIPGEAHGKRGIALAIEPAAFEIHRGKTILIPARTSILEGFPQNSQGESILLPLDLFNPDGQAAPRMLFRLRAGGIRPILKRIYGRADNLSVDYSASAPFAIAAEEPLRSV